MTPQRIDVAIEVLGQFANLAGDVPEEKLKTVEVMTHLTLAQSYLVEYLAHTAQGCGPSEAMLKTIRGELPIGGPA